MTVPRRTLLKHIGTAGTLSLTGCLETDQADLPGSLSVVWMSDTATEYGDNHHAMATTTADGQLVIGVPLNDLDDSETCGVVALDATGDVRWRQTLPPEHCTPHAIGDLGVGDLTGDDSPEFLAATETRDVFAYDAATGEETFQQELLKSIGYNAPVVEDLTGDGERELVVGDFKGNITVVRADESVVWTHELDGTVYVTPIVADFTGDGSNELAVNYGRRPGEVICFNGDGETVWRTALEQVSQTWSLVQRDAGPALAAATGDSIALLNGTSGEQQWTASVGEHVAVGESDSNHVYATAGDGAVHALDLDDGAARWTQQVTDEDVRMPAPALGSITGDGAANVVAAAYDGTVAVLDAETGELFGRRQLDTALYTQPVTADVTGNGSDDILVLYGGGRVAALSYEAETD